MHKRFFPKSSVQACMFDHSANLIKHYSIAMLRYFVGLRCACEPRDKSDVFSFKPHPQIQELFGVIDMKSDHFNFCILFNSAHKIVTMLMHLISMFQQLHSGISLTWQSESWEVFILTTWSDIHGSAYFSVWRSVFEFLIFFFLLIYAQCFSLEHMPGTLFSMVYRCYSRHFSSS